MGYVPSSCKESDTTEPLSTAQQKVINGKKIFFSFMLKSETWGVFIFLHMKP